MKLKTYILFGLLISFLSSNGQDYLIKARICDTGYEWWGESLIFKMSPMSVVQERIENLSSLSFNTFLKLWGNPIMEHDGFFDMDSCGDSNGYEEEDLKKLFNQKHIIKKKMSNEVYTVYISIVKINADYCEFYMSRKYWGISAVFRTGVLLKKDYTILKMNKDDKAQLKNLFNQFSEKLKNDDLYQQH